MTRAPIRVGTVLPDGRMLLIEIDPSNDLVKATIDGEPPPAAMTRDLACTLGQALTKASGVCGQERARLAEQAADRAEYKARKAAEQGKAPSRYPIATPPVPDDLAGSE